MFDTEERMKRVFALIGFASLAIVAFAQTPAAPPAYTQRVLEVLGLSPDEIQQVLQIQADADAQIRRHRADLEIKKAELARLLLDDEPNMRLVERNLRATADIEVAIRLVEIEREIGIRRIVGTERWARIIQAIRIRRDQASGDGGPANSPQDPLAQLQQSIAQTQRQLTELIANARGALNDDEIRRQFRELQNQYEELQGMIRDRLQQSQ